MWEGLNIFRILLFIHIAGGGLSLLAGLYNLVAEKGNKRHQQIGKFYFYAMLTSALVALPMAVIHPTPFLFVIGIFSLYMLLTGKFYLKKRSKDDVQLADWILLGLMLIVACVFIYMGTKAIISANLFGLVFLVFGCFALLFVYQDQRNFRAAVGFRLIWKTMHLQRMVGSYISAATAFLVVNNSFLPSVVAWLLPTVILVPFIIIWSGRYRGEVA